MKRLLHLVFMLAVLFLSGFGVVAAQDAPPEEPPVAAPATEPVATVPEPAPAVEAADPVVPAPTIPFVVQQQIPLPTEIRVDGTVTCEMRDHGIIFCTAVRRQGDAAR